MDIHIEEISAQPIVGVRKNVAQTEIGDTVGQVLGELMPRLGPNAVGAPLARYHTWKGDRGEVEVAVPVKEPMEENELPGGRAVVAVHVGPYDTLKDTWEAVGVWMKAHGLEGRAAPWEQYVSDCSNTPPEKLETRIIWPIE
ncbi:MAG: GyrI-like domain-containing protein [Planctomycetota bacterium]|jgi:effector-binding domain-containing protein